MNHNQTLENFREHNQTNTNTEGMVNMNNANASYQSEACPANAKAPPTTKRKRRNLSGKSDEEKRNERLIANRKAAYNCRMRKRILIEELQRQVVELTKKSMNLEEENKQLRQALLNSNQSDMMAQNQQQQQQQQQVLSHEQNLLSSGNCSVGGKVTTGNNSPCLLHNRNQGIHGTHHLMSNDTNTSLAELVVHKQLQAQNAMHMALLEYQRQSQAAIRHNELSRDASLPYMVGRGLNMDGNIISSLEQQQSGLDDGAHQQRHPYINMWNGEGWDDL